MIICIMSGVEPLSQSRNFIFLDQPCPIAHDNDIGIFLFHQLRFFLPSVRTFLFHQPGFFSAIRNEAFTARFLHRILSLLHRILSFLYWIFSLLHRILSLFEWESWFGFFSSINWDFFLPSVGTFLFHQSGFFSAIRNEAVTARVLHRILSLLHRILFLLYWILSLLHRILSIFKDNHNWDFSLPSVGIFFCHQLGFFSSISWDFSLPSDTRPYGTVSASDTFPPASVTFPSASDTFPFASDTFPS